jgi:hypothetical protein
LDDMVDAGGVAGDLGRCVERGVRTAERSPIGQLRDKQ